MKLLYFSRHARRRMRLHNITQEQVEETLSEPEKVAPGVKGRYVARNPGILGFVCI
ncbi:MAG: hypothetical protein HW384_558 [Dehalococcoidia bacterium]|nr:hypothetical protein [Dehalococcoidia bacterium]